MVRTTKTQKLASTKIYDLLIGLGANKKRAELAIEEFVEDIPKFLATNAAKTSLDPAAPVSKGDIWRLEAIITENKNDTDFKIAKNKKIKKHSKLKSDLEKTIAELKSDLEKTIAELKSDLEKTIAKNKNDTDLKLKDIEKKIVESKNVLLQWILGMITGYTILLIVVLRFFEK